MPSSTDEIIAVIGLGYVGLPVALAFARQYRTIGFDIRCERIEELTGHRDVSHEISPDALAQSSLTLTSDPADLQEATFFIVAVPTPIDQNNRPELEPLCAASETVGGALSEGSVVVYESTVYPGVTEEVCRPVLERTSGLRAGRGFFLGYSPERINPGDQEHTFERITKVVSGQDEQTLQRVAAVYESVVTAGVHRAPSIKVAEAAKVIENTQRDLNIAFMNELALIFDRLGIRTKDVLDAARTKWNFLPFSPGLVGGHCIGVDPYYLTTKAEALGYHPQVILSGRQINNGVGAYVAQRTMKMLSKLGVTLRRSKVGVLGLTFKPNVPDLRNSRVPDIVSELKEFGIEPLVHCFMSCPKEAQRVYGIELCQWEELQELDALIYAVPHDQYRCMSLKQLAATIREGGILVDLKSEIEPQALRADIHYWSL